MPRNRTVRKRVTRKRTACKRTARRKSGGGAFVSRSSPSEETRRAQLEQREAAIKSRLDAEKREKIQKLEKDISTTTTDIANNKKEFDKLIDDLRDNDIEQRGIKQEMDKKKDKYKSSIKYMLGPYTPDNQIDTTYNYVYEAVEKAANEMSNFRFWKKSIDNREEFIKKLLRLAADNYNNERHKITREEELKILKNPSTSTPI